MARVDDWQSNLRHLIMDRMETPFDITDFNCLMWGCESIEACTGINPYILFHGKTARTSKAAAVIFRRKTGFETTTQFLENYLGPRQPLSLLKPGDLICVDEFDPELGIVTDADLFGPPIGVCYGQVSYFLGFDGLVKVHTMQLGQDSYGFYC